MRVCIRKFIAFGKLALAILVMLTWMALLSSSLLPVVARLKTADPLVFYCSAMGAVIDGILQFIIVQ